MHTHDMWYIIHIYCIYVQLYIVQCTFNINCSSTLKRLGPLLSLVSRPPHVLDPICLLSSKVKLLPAKTQQPRQGKGVRYKWGSAGVLPESIEWFREDQAFSPSYNLAPPQPRPPSPVSKLHPRHIGKLRKRASLLIGFEEPDHMTARSLVHYRSFNTL